MLNLIWPIFILISIIYAIFWGDINILNSQIFSSVNQAVEISIELLGTMCLWSGLMNIIKNTKLIKKIEILLNPFINFLFPDIKNNSNVKQEISMNLTANLLGIGNAATPLGLKAMKTLQEKNDNKETLSNSMIMLILLNTASLQIIPTTIIAIRVSEGSGNPTKILVPVWIATTLALVSGVSAVKIFIKLKR